VVSELPRIRDSNKTLGLSLK